MLLFKKYLKEISIIIAISCVVILFALVFKYALNVPYADDFAFIDFINRIKENSDFSNFYEFISARHNEHTIIIPKLISSVDFWIFGDINFRRLIFYANLILLLILFTLFKLHKNYITLGLSALILTVPNNSLNMWAITSIHHLSIELFAILSFFFILKKQSRIYFSLGILSSVLGMATHAAGYFIIPCILFVLLFCDTPRKKIKFSILLAISIFSFYMFLKGYRSLDHHPHMTPQSFDDIVKFFHHQLTLHGNIYYFIRNHALVTPILGIATFVILLLLLRFNWRFLRERPWYLAIICFVLINGAIISISRYGFGWIQATSLRYRIIPSILLVVLISILIERFEHHKNSHKFILGGIVLLLLNYSAGFIRGLNHIQSHHSKLKDAVTLQRIGEPNSYLYPDPPSGANWLKIAEQLGTYSLPSYKTNYGYAFKDEVQLIQSKNVRTNWGIVNDKSKTLGIEGFSILLGTKSKDLEYYVTLTSSSDETYYFKTNRLIRSDVNNAFRDGTNYDWSGFKYLLIKKAANLPDDKYRLGILLVDEKSNTRHYHSEDQIILIATEDNNQDQVSESTICLDSYNNIVIINDPSKIKMSNVKDTLKLRGWAFEHSTGLPANKIYYKVNNHPLREVSFTIRRLDVAKAYKNQVLDTIGFTINIPKKIINKKENNIELIIENRNGRMLSDSKKFILYNE